MERKEAIEIIRGARCTSPLRDALGYLIPELAESEDERIRKALVNFILYKVGHLLDEETEHKFITYLEKQKDLYSPADWNDYKDKPIDIWNAYIKGKALGIKLGKAVVINHPEAYGLENQKAPNARQRLAEWSKTEEGKAKYEEVAKEMRKEMEKEQKPAERFEEAREKYQVEWSEEDEKMRLDTISAFYLAYPYALESENPRKKNIDWLKSLRTSWKPSKEQMEALYTMVCECRPADQQLLQDIYYGLKKLM